MARTPNVYPKAVLDLVPAEVPLVLLGDGTNTDG